MITKSGSEKETQKVASDLANKILKDNIPPHAAVIALEGELGAGKTVFVKSFAKAFGIKRISSPTFILMSQHKINHKNILFKNLIHIDTYRLKGWQDLIPLGIKELINNPENIILIEWSDRVKKILPKKYIKIHIDHLQKNTRKITTTNI